MTLSRIDKAALKLAIAAARKESPGRSQQIESKLRDEPWQEVAKFCASVAQSHSLRLEPWMQPPADIDLDRALAQPFGDVRGVREGGELLAQMLSLGISRYHPSPLDAIDEAEAKAAAP